MGPKFNDQWHGMTAEKIFSEIQLLSSNTPILVTLSGGNPALQPLEGLIVLGKQKDYTFALETQAVDRWL